MKFKSVQASPSQLLVLVFLFFILLGTLLLKLPLATHVPMSWIDTLFTAASAMTVTGLAVVDTGRDFTLFGQLMILILIQVGGLGIMSFAVLIFIIPRKKDRPQRAAADSAIAKSDFYRRNH